MKNQIKEGLIDKIMTMIAKGRVDSKVKKMMKDDPKFAKEVARMRQAQKDLQKALDNF
tara:strand:+ start:1369 stop:1542 length:174 start_codon:yes stop_codon:yes gene_type:complete